MNDNFNIISRKLESFIKKYYLFKMIRGLFFIMGLYILIVLVESVIEYFNYLNVSSKTFIFYFSILSFLALFVYYFVFPLLSLFKLRKHLSYSEASKIISRYFPDINDKLLNALELNGLQDAANYKPELIIASINQRSLELSPFPFSYAINFGYLKRNLLFFAISFIILTAILAFSPHILFDGTTRLVDYTNHYEPEAPFKFKLLNNNLLCERGKNFIVELKIEGEYIPENLFVKIGDNQFLMTKERNLGYYKFVVRNVNNSLDFQFFADKFYSKIHQLIVLPAPVLKSFFIDIHPPAYTGIEAQKILNSGDITVPFGSTVKWNFNTNNVTQMDFVFGSDTTILESGDNEFSNSQRVLDNSSYSVGFKNTNFISEDVLSYTINVIPDQLPEIELKRVEDSTKVGAYYFMISVKDDYGFRDLNFVKQIVSDDSTNIHERETLALNKLTKYQNVFYYYNFNEIENLDDESVVEYYFEVRDNDYIRGYKSARTTVMVFKPYSLDQIRKVTDKYEKNADDAISKSKKLTKDIQKEIEEFKRKQLNDELNDWEKQNFLKSILEKQKELEKSVENVLEQNQKKNSLNNQFYSEQKDIIEKQKQIQELLNEILDDELKELLKEIEELSKKFNEKQFEQTQDKLDLSYKNLDKKLDRSLEMLKRYQVEEKIMHLSNDIDKLAEQQEKLAEEKSSKKEIGEKQKKQQKLNDEFKQIKKNLEETHDKNKELKSPYKIEKFDDSFKQIEQKMDDLQKNIPSNSKKKTKQQQQDISKDLKEMSKQMQSMFKEMNMQAMNLNMRDLRQLIDNLSTFSFSQEENYNLLNKNFSNSPQYPDIVSNQNKMRKDFELIQDSLVSLANRIPQMNQIIMKESESINFNLEKVNAEVEARHRRAGLRIQRHIMNSTNTLALYLEELMQQMQNQMKGGNGGKGGQSMPAESMQNLKGQQEKLKQELEQLLEQMKKNGGKQDGGEMNNQIVKTLAEQEIFNKMLKDLQNGKGISPKSDQKLKEIKKLSDQNINDLINKNITPELFKRNKEIKTRLLEAEKSERERDQEKKRESKEGKKKDLIVPEELKESLKNNQNYKETLQKNNLNMKKYYQNLSNEYFRIINN